MNQFGIAIKQGPWYLGGGSIPGGWQQLVIQVPEELWNRNFALGRNKII